MPSIELSILIRTINLKRDLYFEKRHFINTSLQVTFSGFMKNSSYVLLTKIATYIVTRNKTIVHYNRYFKQTMFCGLS